MVKYNNKTGAKKSELDKIEQMYFEADQHVSELSFSALSLLDEIIVLLRDHEQRTLSEKCLSSTVTALQLQAAQK